MAYDATVSGNKGVTVEQARVMGEALKYSGPSYEHPTQQAMLGEPTSNQTPSFGGTFTVSQIASDFQGHVSSMTDRTVRIPDSVATSSNKGLMSAADKAKLDNEVLANLQTQTKSSLVGAVNELVINKATTYENVTFYIDPNGSDTTGDGSAEAPFATIQKAMGLLSGGKSSSCTICLNPGVYNYSLDNGHLVYCNNQFSVTIKARDGLGTVTLNITESANGQTQRNIFSCYCGYYVISDLIINIKMPVKKQVRAVFVTEGGTVRIYNLQVNVLKDSNGVTDTSELFIAYRGGTILATSNIRIAYEDQVNGCGIEANYGGKAFVKDIKLRDGTGFYGPQYGNYVSYGQILVSSDVDWGAWGAENYINTAGTQIIQG